MADVFERIKRDPAVRDRVSAALVCVNGVREPDSDAAEALTAEISGTQAALRARFAGLAPAEMPILQPARQLYRSFGVDPTKTRPSPEALLRRILRGDAFPRVHPAVDLGNLWAVVSGLPVGLYDLERVAPGDIVVRAGLAGESYQGIRKDEVHLAGRLVVADALGPFGNPSSDSLRTSVSPTLRDCLYVMFAPTEINVLVLDGWAAWLRDRAEAFLGGRAISALLP